MPITFKGTVLVSACLVGKTCRYDRTHCLVREVQNLMLTTEVVMACPEELGGLFTPREQAEIIGGVGEDVLDGRARVVNKSGVDLTDYYLRGAEAFLAMAKEYDVAAVIVKSGSPSCGFGFIPDGTFSGERKDGNGVAVALLKRHGIVVMTELECLARS